MRTNALVIAERLVRDSLDTLIQRHERGTDDVSRAVVAMAMSLLEHVDAEAKALKAAL